MRILIIEDEDFLSALLKDNFQAHCFSVDTAEDGEKGLYLAKTNDYDLIILDLILPKKGGLEICREIREKKDTPVLVLTVESEIEDKTTLLNSGADDYVTKPFSFEELLARVKSLLRRPGNIKKEIMKVKEVILDGNSYSVTAKGNLLKLTRKEFALLQYLMKNKGFPLSRAMILEHVWDINADPFSNTIESHILNLRKKLGKAGIRNLIVTIPGIGYKIE